MISIVQSGGTGAYDKRSIVVCNSHDEKPTAGIAHGSMAEEVDTGDIYLFDEEAKSWIKI